MVTVWPALTWTTMQEVWISLAKPAMCAMVKVKLAASVRSRIIHFS